MAFVHLHLHTIYSFLDGLVKPGDLAKKLKKLGMNAVAITDHGNMHGVVDFYTTMIGKDEKGNYNKLENAAIKPIIGMEAYISAHDRREKVAKDAFHLLLLAENEKGYKNLCYMASTAFIDGFYYKPRIDRALIKEHSEGIIATSACLGGEISRALIDGRDGDAKKIALEYIELFGKDNFFIELQVNGIKEQEEVNPKLIKLARELGVGLVATNDVHYLSPEHAEAQDILFCINEKKKVTDTDRMHHDVAAFYLKSEEEMRSLFSVYGEAGTEAIDNTAKIAERCNVTLDLGQSYLPIFNTGEKTPAQFLRDMAEQGLEERFLELGTPEEKKQSYRDRLEYELGVIIRMDFPGYFLIVSDFIRWAKDHGIPVGPGRGSGAGSLVAYCTRITDLDPLRYELLFERFLNPERISMPDFDVDFCQDNRERVIEYVEEKYGHENVAQIATFGQLKAKSAIRDVARTLDMTPVGDKLAKLVPDSFAEMYSPQYLKNTKDITAKLINDYHVSSDVAADPDKLRKAIENLKIAPEDVDKIKSFNAVIDAFANERQVIRDNDDFSKIIKIAVQIEGLLRQPGKHACGLVIGQKPIYEYSPIFVDKDNYRVTQYEKTNVELVGLVKFDFLGLKTLTMINHAVTLVRKKKPDFDISKIPLDDAATYKYICENSTKGIFQMESGGFEKMIHQMKPDRIEDLIAAVALYRPGPMDIIPNYIRRKHGKEPIEYDHPWLSEILSETYGLMVYQEQVMQISRRLAGFTMGQADGLRKAMGKKIAAKMAEAKVKFIDGAKEKGIPEKTAKLVFDHMEKFASYGFNKSHAACYGYISYQTAYLKTHYPTEFLTALITSEAGDANKVFMYISDAGEHGIKVYLPDINKSFNSFSIEENAIRYGFGAVKNVGEAAVDEIMKEREKNGDFKSLIDFTSRMSQSKVNSRAIEFLIKAGAFDFTGINRGVLLAILPLALKEGEKAAEDKDSGQLSLFAAFESDFLETNNSGITDEDLIKQIDKKESLDIFDSLALEREVLGIYLSNHPARFFRKDFQNLKLSSISDVIEDVESGKRFYGQKNDNWVPGIITTEIKPVKSRDGRDYYLKGILESEESSVEFSINKIGNPLGNPDVAKLMSKVPLIFRVRGRAVMTGDDEEKTLEKVIFSINDIKEDVKTIDQFMLYCMKDDVSFEPILVYECSEVEFLKNKDELKQIFSAEPTAFKMKMQVKINFGDSDDNIVLEKVGNIDLSRLAEYKSVLGYDNLYLKVM